MNITPTRALRRTTNPATEPVTLTESKLYLRVSGSEEDTLITALITAAREAAEQHLRRSLITRQWTLTFDEHVLPEIALPMGPVQSVVSVTCINRDASTEAVSSSLYSLSADTGTLFFDTVVTAHQVAIVYSAGYGAASDVPHPIKQGILAHIAALYDGRQDASFSASILALYQPYREVTL